MTNRATQRLGRLPFFSEPEYICMNPDVAKSGIDVLHHILDHAIRENRPIFGKGRITRAWGEAIASTRNGFEHEKADLTEEDLGRLTRQHPRISVFVNSGSGFESQHLASSLASDLAGIGFQTSVQNETADPALDHGIAIFVGPHEFFSLGGGLLWARAKAVEHGFVHNALPIHRDAFRQALPIMLASRGILDASPQMAYLFRHAHIPAFYARAGTNRDGRWLRASDLDHPLIKALPAASRRVEFDSMDWVSRPIDVSFFGRHSSRRSAFFGRNAAAFSDLSSYIYHQKGGKDDIDEFVERRAHFRIAGHISARSRITLNVREDEFYDFDWYRFMAQPMASGSVVVCDFCPPHPLFKPGLHLFEEDTRHLPPLVRWLLLDEDGRNAAQEVRARVLSCLQDDASRQAKILAAFLCSHMP